MHIIALNLLLAFAYKQVLKFKVMLISDSPADLNDIEVVESLKFDIGMIRNATNNFSEDRKLGEGGFGEVYRVLIIIHAFLLPFYIIVLVELSRFSNL